MARKNRAEATAYHLEWVRRNKAHLRQYNMQKYDEAKFKLSNHHYQKHYGISRAQYIQMYYAQEGKCAICGRASKRALGVDHDHVSGKVRELLCHACNTGIGMFKDDRFTLENAIAYLSKHYDDPFAD